MNEIFYDPKYCQSAYADVGMCEYLVHVDSVLCKKYGAVLSWEGFIVKCPECIKETKELYPELFI